jgi:hypothetical protein
LCFVLAAPSFCNVGLKDTFRLSERQEFGRNFSFDLDTQVHRHVSGRVLFITEQIHALAFDKTNNETHHPCIWRYWILCSLAQPGPCSRWVRRSALIVFVEWQEQEDSRPLGDDAGYFSSPLAHSGISFNAAKETGQATIFPAAASGEGHGKVKKPGLKDQADVLALADADSGLWLWL